VKFLLKTIGTGKGPIDEFWIDVPEDTKWLAFPKHRIPDIANGDRLLLYATGHQRIIAAGRFTADARRDPDKAASHSRFDPGDEQRWPWIAEWEPQLLVPNVNLGFRLGDIGISTLSVRSQSHIHIDEAQYRKAVGLLATAAAANGEAYVPAYRDAVWSDV
jgi:hypothetical protein